MTFDPQTFIEAHANDITRGDWIDLNKALNTKLANGLQITTINPDTVFAGDIAEVLNVSFRPNGLTRLRVQFMDSKFNLTYNDDTLLLVRENEQDKLEALEGR